MGSKGKSFRVDKIIANLTEILQKHVLDSMKLLFGKIYIDKKKKIVSFLQQYLYSMKLCVR